MSCTSSLGPACGGFVEGKRTIIANGKIVHGGQIIAVTPQEERVLSAFLDAWPKVLPKDDIYDAIVGDNPDTDSWPDLKITDVVLCKLRKVVEPVGIAIETLARRGYAMRFADVASSEAMQVDADTRRATRLGLSTKIGPAEEDRMRQLKRTGATPYTIARTMGLPYPFVHRAMKALGLLASQPAMETAA